MFLPAQMRWRTETTSTANVAMPFASQTYLRTDGIANAFARSIGSGVVDEFVPNKRIDQASFNLLWGVTRYVEAGVEYSWGRRITSGDEEGIQHRINTMIQFNYF